MLAEEISDRRGRKTLALSLQLLPIPSPSASPSAVRQSASLPRPSRLNTSSTNSNFRSLPSLLRPLSRLSADGRTDRWMAPCFAGAKKKGAAYLVGSRSNLSEPHDSSIRPARSRNAPTWPAQRGRFPVAGCLSLRLSGPILFGGKASKPA